ncbi:transcriptional regulator [Mesorhizobium sanjuanii]|uniref:Transcriptional regulator n=1 Tax=Mesorhizobium sanjuanii TaxID=2037900 RepID=A0A2A6FK46_9HYPH|nr:MULTISPECIES: XRE family transcriptional regulator [Mesorhizobium]PDQ22011.1 transcriptional regulator [Mesorhizobium sanjuanii]CCV11767.1 Helix-turn-helix domain protein [Mesorhizobium sp. STM 4661]
MIGRRLKTARAALSLSLRDLSAVMGAMVSPQAIGKYERDEDMPSSRVLGALARALQTSVDYLLSGEMMSLEGVEFRRRTKSSKEENSIEARTIHLLERYLAVEELLKLRSLDWEKPRGAPFPTADVRDAEDAARSVREDWGLGIDPIPRLAELLEERGIKVLSLPLTDLDGLAAKVMRKDREAARVIVIRRDTWSERKRFSLAHELGHMVMSPTAGVDPEKAAHRFAGAFLIPADALRAEMGSQRSSISIGELAALKRRYGVSIQAIAYRCRDLAIINAATLSSLYTVFTERGWRSAPFEEPERIPFDYEEPHRLERLCLRALTEGVVGQSRAAELLGISLVELDSRLSSSEA